MFCLYSKGCEHAIRAMVEIAAEIPGQRCRAKDICRRAGIPEAYSRKTFQSLVQNGFLKAVPGPGGGYALVSDPARTTVMDVVDAVDGRANYSGCVMGLPTCGDRNPCQMHFKWLALKEKLIGSLRSVTLTELAKTASRRRR